VRAGCWTVDLSRRAGRITGLATGMSWKRCVCCKLVRGFMRGEARSKALLNGRAPAQLCRVGALAIAAQGGESPVGGLRERGSGAEGRRELPLVMRRAGW